MSSFDYGNARLRALKARLLERNVIQGLLNAGSPANMLAALRETAYRPVVDAALVRATGLSALTDALARDLHNSLGRQPTFFKQDPAATLIRWLLRRYDLFNVKTALRGVSQGVSPDLIREQMAPIGELRSSELDRLIRAESSVALIGLLATWRTPFAEPLLALQAERPDADLALREHALDQWWARGAWSVHASPVWREYVTHETDAANIMTALRLVGTAVDPSRLTSQFITVPDAGRAVLAPERLAVAAQAPDLAAAVTRLDATPYGEALQEAWEEPAGRRRLSQLERTLDLLWLRKAVSFFHRDPLGIGVPLGYLALKVNEVKNLRFIGHGLFLEEAPDQISDRLLFP